MDPISDKEHIDQRGVAGHITIPVAAGADAPVTGARLSAPPTLTAQSTHQDLANNTLNNNVISLPSPPLGANASAQFNQTSKSDIEAASTEVTGQSANGAANGDAGQASNHIIAAPLSPPPTEDGPAPAQPPPNDALQQQQQQLQQPNNQFVANQGQWLAQVANQTQQGVRQRMSQASDQLGHSLRQMYASASSITTAAGVAVAAVDVPPSYHNIPGIVPYYHGRSIGPPPSYDDVINPYAPPPSYQSLFGQLREARKTSRGLLDLLRRLVIILASTLGCTLLIAFMILIPFTMIIIGAIYIDECKIEHIPAFLLVGGLVWASKNIVHCYAQCRKVERQEHSDALAAEMYLNSSSFASSSSSSLSPSPSTSSSSSSSSTSSDHMGPIHTTGTRDCTTLATPNGAFADEDIDDLQLGQRMSSSSQPTHQHMTDTTTASHRSRHSHHHHHHHHHHHRHRHRRGHHRRGEQQQQRRSTSRLKSSICESLLNCVLFGWFIAGCVIVFRNYEPEFDNPTSARYCHRTVYMYTFWLITSAILSFGLFISCICCLMVSSALASRQSDIGLA